MLQGTKAGDTAPSLAMANAPPRPGPGRVVPQGPGALPYCSVLPLAARCAQLPRRLPGTSRNTAVRRDKYQSWEMLMGKALVSASRA